MIIGIYRDWAFNVYCYECVGSEVNFTEGVIDFYQEKENGN